MSERSYDPDARREITRCLNAVDEALRRYVWLERSEHYTAVTLHVIHTHCFAAADFSPRLLITSGVRGSGKTLLLSLLAYLDRRSKGPMLVPSAANVRRAYMASEGSPPTYVFDEVDGVFSKTGVEDNAELLAGLSDPDYPGKVERAILFTVEAWDINCQQHIHQRLSQRQISPLITELQARIAALEEQLHQRQGPAQAEVGAATPG